MNEAPPLQSGEEIVFDHVPSLRVFKHVALLMLVMTLPAVAVFLVVFPDTFWPAIPLFATCVILMQERVRLGRYRAWVTNQRILMQGDRSVDLGDVLAVAKAGNGVRVNIGAGVKGIKLYYPADSAALVAAIKSAKEAR